MPSDDDTRAFVREAFNRGLTEDQVKQALILRRQKLTAKLVINAEEDDSWWDSMPTWWKKGYNESIEGLSRQIATGKPVFQIPEDYDPGILEDIGATVASFFTPTDIGIFAGGTLAGGFGGPVATTAAKASARATLNLLVKAGVKSSVAKKVAISGALKAVERNIARAVGQGTALGFYSGIGGTLQNKIVTGEWDPIVGLEAAAGGFFLGSTAGFAGGIAGGATTKFGKLVQVPSEITAEASAFAVAGAAIEGKPLELNDFVHSAGVILGMRSAKVPFLPFKGVKGLVELKTKPKYIKKDGTTTYRIAQVKTKPDGTKILLRENLKTGKQSWIEKEKFEVLHTKLRARDIPAIIKKTIKVPDFEKTKHSAPPKPPQRRSLLAKAHQLQKLNLDIVKRRKGKTDKEKWAKFKKDKFGKESMKDFSNEEIVQFMQVVESQAGDMFKPIPKPIKQKIEEAHWNETRADVFIDIKTESTFERNLLSRLHMKMNKMKEGKAKDVLKTWLPSEESASSLNDPLSWRLLRDTSLIAKNVRRVADERILKNLLLPIKEATEGRISKMTDFETKNYELLKRVAEVYDGKEAKGAADGRFTAGDVIKVAAQIGKFDKANHHYVRAARLFSSFKSGKKETRPKGIPDADLKRAGVKFNPKHKAGKKEIERRDNEFYTKMEGKFSKLLDMYGLDKAIRMFSQDMKDFKFGFKKKYTPQDWQTNVAHLTELVLRGKSTRLPTGRYHVRKAEGIRSPERMLSWIKNGYYRDMAMLHLDHRVGDLGRRLKKINPDNIRHITPYIQSLYGLPQGRIKIVSTTAGLSYTSWLMSAWPTVRNLTQNFARMMWFPKVAVLRNIKWAMKNIENKKYFSEADKKFFIQQISEMTGVADSHLLSYTYWRNAPKAIRKYEDTFKFISRHYPWSDTINRKMLFAWLKPLHGEVNKYLNHEGVYADRTKAYETLSRRLRVGQMQDVVQVHLRGTLERKAGEKKGNDVLARDFMQEYIRQMETDVHHQYLRHERPIWMQKKTMKPFAGLLTYSNSTWAKVWRESKIMTEKGRTPMERVQAGEILLNQFADVFARMALRVARYGTSIWALKSLTSEEDKNAYKNIKAEDAYDTMSWLIPSLAANNLVELITDRPATYGAGELFVRLPLEISTVSQFAKSFLNPLYEVIKDIDDEDSWTTLLNSTEKLGVNTLPLLDTMITFLSINSDMFHGSLFEDFIPAAIQGDMTPEKMRRLKLEFRGRTRDRFNYISSKEFDDMEKLVYGARRMLVHGERRLGELRERASEPFIHGIVLEDMASRLYRDDPETAEKLRLMADEYFEKHEEAQKFVPQRAARIEGGAPYVPGKQKIIKEMRELQGLPRMQ